MDDNAELADEIDVEHGGETIAVPTKFERVDLAAWFGSVPESFAIDRIFTGEDGELRVESNLGGGGWVEAVLHTDEWHETFNARNDRGWVADRIQGSGGEDTEGPGETLWER